jgi:hypothetical protein
MMMFYRQVFRKESTVRIALLFALGFLLLGHSLFAASPGPALEKAKKDAEAKGYVFFSNRDEIIAKAKKEVKLRVLANLEPPNIKATTPAFIKRYPFIDLYVEEAQGTEQMQRRFLAIQSGMAKEWDIIPVSTDLYSQHLPYLWKVDVFAMASHQVLAISPQMIDPKNRNVMALFTRFQVTAYNKQMLPSAQVPKTWEDFLKPEFKGRKFAADGAAAGDCRPGAGLGSGKNRGVCTQARGAAAHMDPRRQQDTDSYDGGRDSAAHRSQLSHRKARSEQGSCWKVRIYPAGACSSSACSERCGATRRTASSCRASLVGVDG